MQKILFKVSDKVETGINFQLSTSSNIPRYDRLTDLSGGNLKYAEWNYGPQKRMLASAYAAIKSEGMLFNNMRVTAAYQDIDQERITRRFKKDDRQTQHEDVQVYSLNADLMKQVNEHNELRYGLEITHNNVNSVSNIVNISSNTEKAGDTRYPDGGSTYSTFAGYATHSWEISEKAILSEGLRFTHTGLNATFKDTSYFPFPYRTATQSNNALSGSLGLVLMPHDNVRFNILASTGFKAPNVDDLGKVFDSSPGMVIVPNPNLQPEYAYNVEAGFANLFADNKWKLEGSCFYTLLTNAMVVKDFKLNGKDSVLYGGVLSKVVAAQNADEAYIQGVTGTLTADLNDNFSFKSSITYTRGSYKDNENDTIVPLDHIAPLFGRTGIIHRYKKV
ncbi:MAG: TonB-dependent receptor, partial [Bacteroidia bacterium]|nr:TonB-dependent receptor [Bacteroidia bacterium]